MTKKKETEKKEEPKKAEPKSNFDLEEALSHVNRFLRPGFEQYIKDKDVKTQKQFDKYHKEYGAMK